MDPILEKIIAALSAARAANPKEFAKLSSEQIDAYIKEESQGKYGLSDVAGVSFRNVGRSVAQGVLGNFGDELMGKLSGPDAENEMRLREDLFRREHPNVNTAGQMAGAALPWLAAPEVKGATLAGQIARGVAIGGGTGAIAGAGAGEDAESRKGGALIGGLLGAGIGGTIPASAGLGNYVDQPASAAAARLASAVKKSGGTEPLRNELLNFDRQGLGKDVMLADLSPFLRNQADFAATNSEDVFVPLSQKLAGRQADQSDYLLQSARGLAKRTQPSPDLSSPESMRLPTNAVQQQAALESSRKEFAAGPEGYGGLRESDATFDIGPLKSALTKKPVLQAWKQARLAGDLTTNDPLDQLLQRITEMNPGVDPTKIVKGLQSQGVSEAYGVKLALPQMREVSFDDLLQFKRVLDDKVSGAYAKGNGALAGSYKTIRNAVNDVLEQGAPGYRDVSAQYSQMKGLEAALEDGKKAWNTLDSDELAAKLGKMSPDELEQFRVGMASEMADKLRSAATNRDQATQLVNASPKMQDKLKVVFGDQDTFDAFMDRAKAASVLHKLNGAVGNSATARRLSEAGVSPAELGIDFAEHSARHGPFVAGVRQAARAARSAVVRGTARELGPSLLTQGTGPINGLLDQLSAPNNPILNRFWTSVLPSTVTRGLLAGNGY